MKLVIFKAIYGVINHMVKCGMSFYILKLHEEMYHVSPPVAINLSNQNRIQHVAFNLSDRVTRA